MYVKVTFLGIPVIVIAMETQPCFPIVLLITTCSCQQYETVVCCHGNATLRFVCTAVGLRNIAYCCQQYECTWVFVWNVHYFRPMLTKFGFIRGIFLYLQYQKFTKSIQWKPCWYTRTDRQTGGWTWRRQEALFVTYENERASTQSLYKGRN